MTNKPRLLAAVDLLKEGRRAEAAALLSEEFSEAVNRQAAPHPALSRLALQIGEIDLALAASRESVGVDTVSLSQLLAHWALMAENGRVADVTADLDRLPQALADSGPLLHFRGTLATEAGDFERGEELLRRAIASDGPVIASWFTLAMSKTFTADDPDLAAMLALAKSAGAAPTEEQARLQYAIGKAYDDIGDAKHAFPHFAQGAAMRRAASPQADSFPDKAETLVRDFTPEAMAGLRPPQAPARRALFVTGLPRSGTTLAEQMLVSHSAVKEGAETNLLRAALIPTVDLSLDGAMRFQDRVSDDPWGQVANDYHRMMAMRFGKGALAVDKTLNLSSMMGLLLHALPDARVIWLRRRPDDAALSCFKSCFTRPLPWTLSLTEMGRHFRAEDRLFAHWTSLFPDRILAVPYEELVSAPGDWAETIAAHAGLEMEPAMRKPHLTPRAVQTASVRQVRGPVSKARVGSAGPYRELLAEFHAAYDG